MARVSAAYVVRDAGGRDGPPEPDDIYPYTLSGLLDALEGARLRSFGAAPPQEVVAIPPDKPGKVIRRYEHGDEASLPPQPPDDR